ncbi:MAG TPA: hypothetical protein VE967_02845 [Gemmatimonadaceae bacterium]|nr:hypothetical protein [Gemmatimonadaceae bacterium]
MPDFRAAFNTLEPLIERRYGIPVRITDVPNPFTGDLDGAEIQIDYDQNIEDAVFIIAHLFGHTVQWCLSERAREIGTVIPKNPSEAELAEIRAYEHEACRYSVQLFHDAGLHEFDQWLSDFAACDYAYLEHFYRTGEKREFKSFWRDGQPIVEPLAIPPFRPAQWVSRWKGTVV